MRFGEALKKYFKIENNIIFGKGGGMKCASKGLLQIFQNFTVDFVESAFI